MIDNDGQGLPEEIAPGMNQLGWMLPYTPLHHLLVEAVGWPLIMTSGNVSNEPQVIDNEEACEKLSHIADSFLMHDRKIARRLDDSVVKATPTAPTVIRRARGVTPGTISLPDCGDDRQVLAREGTSKRRIQDVVDLVFLAPDILQQVIAGTLPLQAASDVLIKRGVPGRWTEQRLLIKENPVHSNAA